MKILIPIIGFGRAGGYRVLSNLANEFIALGNKVSFLVHVNCNCVPYFPTKAEIIKFNSNGSIVVSAKHNFFSVNQFDVHKTFPTALEIYYGMYKAIAHISKGYDLILANQCLTSYPVFFAKSKTCKKIYYIQAYEPEYYKFLGKSLKNCLLQILAKTSYLLPLYQVANSPLYLNYKSIRAKDWVPPAIDFNTFFPQARPTSSNQSNRFYIGVIGRAEKHKGTIYAFQAFESLRSQYPNLVLRVAYGPVPAHLEDDDQVELIVPNNDHELSNFYRSVNVLVAPGVVQLGAYHYPVLESMACGTPTITTGYSPANNTNSWIVSPHSSQEIAESIIKIMFANPTELNNRIKKAQADVSILNWPTSAQKFLEIIQKS